MWLCYVFVGNLLFNHICFNSVSFTVTCHPYSDGFCILSTTLWIKMYTHKVWSKCSCLTRCWSQLPESLIWSCCFFIKSQDHLCFFPKLGRFHVECLWCSCSITTYLLEHFLDFCNSCKCDNARKKQLEFSSTSR